jgi:hypothetical protein
MKNGIEPYIFPFITFLGVVMLAEHLPFAGWVLFIGLGGIVLKYL